LSAAVDVAAAAGPGIGGGLAAWGGLRFIRWLVEFAFKRMDVRATRLDTREKALEARFNDRLRHVELELNRYRQATMLLVNALAERDPTNRVLSEVARILNTAIPIVPPRPDLENLAGKAGEAINGMA
jgi:hypothetical protein